MSALLAAALIVFGGLAEAWWSQDEGDLRSTIGLREAAMCRDAACSRVSLGELARDSNWVRAGYAAYTAAMLAGGLLFAVAVVGAARRREQPLGRLLPRAASAAVAGAVVAGIGFVWTAPEYPGMTPSHSMLLYFAGAALGVVAGILAATEPARDPGTRANYASAS